VRHVAEESGEGDVVGHHPDAVRAKVRGNPQVDVRGEGGVEVVAE